jgi:hypothetical protein
MSGPRVLLMTLSERTSAKGTAYLSGWLGKARFVGFKAKDPDKYGNERWDIYAQEPEPKSDSDQAPRQTRNAERGQRTWDRARDAGRAQAAGEAVLAAAGRDRTPEPPQSWIDDTEAAIAGLERGR